MMTILRAPFAPRRIPAAFVAALALVTACNDQALDPPPAVDPMFARYVALGNSITAGFQSAGINDSTQLEAYPLLLAEAFGLRVIGSDADPDFTAPLLNAPGCPAPYTNVFAGARLGGAGPTDCALRKAPTPTHLNNVAVPGAAVIDVLNNLAPASDPNALTAFFLGGRTQLQAVREIQPTFATVWIGNNDVLAAALAGDTSFITPTVQFQQAYETLVDSLLLIPSLEGVALVGVANVTTIPHLSPGAAYWVASQDPSWPGSFNVDDNCAPSSQMPGSVGDSTLVPFGYGFGVLMAQALQGGGVTLDCVNDPPVLTWAEIIRVGTAVLQFNQIIGGAAQTQGWAFLNVNVPFDSLVQTGAIPLFPNIGGGPPFGNYFSQDGVHPNATMHALIADYLLAAINTTYGTTISR